mgnify:CR=1 FL=1
MIEQTVTRIRKQLEILAESDIPMARGLDLLEATTQDLEEIVIINTMRESLEEISERSELRFDLTEVTTPSTYGEFIQYCA